MRKPSGHQGRSVDDYLTAIDGYNHNCAFHNDDYVAHDNYDDCRADHYGAPHNGPSDDRCTCWLLSDD